MVNELATVSVPVNGMACDACARRLEKVLVQTRGVSQALVSFEAKEVRVSYDPRQIGIDQIGERIVNAGFKPNLQTRRIDPKERP